MAAPQDKPHFTLSPTTLRMNPDVAHNGVVLEITNPAETSILYKCKTTTPARYIVRNRQGVIAAGSSTRVHISLQRGHVITGNEGSDIFLVEARYLRPGEAEKATKHDADIGALMKELGKQAIAKHQVICELATAADGAKKPTDAQSLVSQSTQPTAVKQTAASAAAAAAASPAGQRDPLRRDEAAAASPAADRAAGSPAGQSDPLRRPEAQEVRNRSGVSPTPNTTAPRASTSLTEQKKPAAKANPLTIAGVAVTVLAAGAYFVSGSGAKEEKEKTAKADL